MSTQDQKNWNHNFTTFLAQVMQFQARNYFKSTYLAQFNSPRKIPEIVDFIFLSNSTVLDEYNKIWFTPFGYS